MSTHLLKNIYILGLWRLIPIVLVTWEVEIGRIQGQPRQKQVPEIPSQKKITE
jgi:hypothetical protein